MVNSNRNNFNGGAKRKEFNSNRKPREEYEAERKVQIERQSKCIDIIEAIAEYLDNFLKASENFKVSMKEVLTYLSDKGFNTDDTKVVSQLNYIMIDLANARKNKNVSGDRLNIRVMYIQERFKTSYKKELHDRIVKLMETYDTLFAWSNDATGDDYQTVEEKKD